MIERTELHLDMDFLPGAPNGIVPEEFVVERARCDRCGKKEAWAPKAVAIETAKREGYVSIVVLHRSYVTFCRACAHAMAKHLTGEP